jgi:hypothetical protein
MGIGFFCKPFSTFGQKELQSTTAHNFINKPNNVLCFYTKPIIIKMRNQLNSQVFYMYSTYCLQKGRKAEQYDRSLASPYTGKKTMPQKTGS